MSAGRNAIANSTAAGHANNTSIHARDGAESHHSDREREGITVKQR
jgi:hypothetical protein